MFDGWIDAARDAGWPAGAVLFLALVLGGVGLASRRQAATDDRQTKKDANLSAGETALRADLMTIIAELRKMIGEQDATIATLTRENAECRTMHAKCEGRITALEGSIDLMGQQIARLVGVARE